MRLSLIVAMARNRSIGLRNRLPWHVPADLKRFRQLTWGKPLIMGRKTHESIGRPLPGRTNIVISSNPAYRAEGCLVVPNPDAALALAAAESDEIMVIGGASLYQDLLPRADRVYMTLIHRDYPGDTFFPELETADWVESDRLDVTDDPSVDFAYSFLVLDRRQSPPGLATPPDTDLPPGEPTGGRD